MAYRAGEHPCSHARPWHIPVPLAPCPHDPTSSGDLDGCRFVCQARDDPRRLPLPVGAHPHGRPGARTMKASPVPTASGRRWIGSYMKSPASRRPRVTWMAVASSGRHATTRVSCRSCRSPSSWATRRENHEGVARADDVGSPMNRLLHRERSDDLQVLRRPEPTTPGAAAVAVPLPCPSPGRKSRTKFPDAGAVTGTGGRTATVAQRQAAAEKPGKSKNSTRTR